MKILLVEDDPGIAGLLKRELTDQLHVLDVADNGISGEDLALSNDYDVILLDVMLPKKDGRAVCRTLRNEGVTTPILMMTALAEAEDVIEGLDNGADDYLIKPFHIGVLLARIRSIVRRNGENKSTEIQVADLVLSTARRTVSRSGRQIHLSPREFALLEYFVMNQDRVLTRDMISERVWEMNFDPRSNVIDSLVRFLRIRIDRGFTPQLVHTVRGTGYLFGIQE